MIKKPSSIELNGAKVEILESHEFGTHILCKIKDIEVEVWENGCVFLKNVKNVRNLRR